MGTILITNLAPIDATAAKMFEALFDASLQKGHTCVFWSCIHRKEHSPFYLPMRWDIGLWEDLFFKDVLKGYSGEAPAEAAEVWLPRLDRLCKQSAPRGKRSRLLETAYAVSRSILDRICPDILLSWNPLCPHTGILTDLCRNRGIPVYLLERGPLPSTWYFEPGGLVGHSVLADVSLESLIPEEQWPGYARFGKQTLEELDFEAFNCYPQSTGTATFHSLIRNISKTKTGPKIAFFPPDDTSLGFTPEDHEDRRKHLPGYASSYEAALALARGNPGGMTLFKPHPSFLEEDLPEEGAHGLLKVEEDFRRMIQWADVVGTSGSGLQLVALAAGKPVVSTGRDLLTGKGITYEARRPDQAADAVSQAATRDGFQERIDRFHTFIGYLVRHFLLSMDLPGGLRPGPALKAMLAEQDPPGPGVDLRSVRGKLATPEGMRLT